MLPHARHVEALCCPVSTSGVRDEEQVRIILSGSAYSRQLTLSACGRVVRHVPSGVWKVQGRDGVERATTVVDGQRSTLEW